MSSRLQYGYGVLIGILAIVACAKAPVKVDEPALTQPAAATFRSTAELVKDPALAGKVDQLAAKDELQSEYIGYELAPSKTYALFQEIASAASRQQLLALLQHQSPVVRGYAVMHVKESFAEEAAALGPLLGDETEVNSVFGCFEGPYRLCVLTWSGLPLEALGRLRATMTPIARSVKHSCWGYALVGLAKLRDQSVVSIAEPLLGSDDPATVGNALEALRLADVKTSAARIRALASSPNALIRASVASVLGHFRGAESELVLRRLLDDTDENVRGDAVESYVQQDSRDPGLLQTALQSSNDSIRLHVDLGLTKDARPESLALLRQRLESRSYGSPFWDKLERALARKELRLDALRALIRSLHGNPESEFAASRASGVLFAACDKECLPTFRERLQQGTEEEQQQAASAVARLEDRRSIPSLLALLQAPNPSTRLAAARALLELKVHAAISDIEKAAAQIPEDPPELKASMQEVLSKLRTLRTLPPSRK